LLAADMMSADAVSDGRLVRPFDQVVEGPQAYWLVSARGRRESRKVKAFRTWLEQEVPASVGGYVSQSKA
jgi:DNA-binding transcriptional LysR family regulator